MTTYHSRGSTIGDYRIEHELLRTRTVVVYRAVHATLGRPVAIKVLDEKTARLRGAGEQFVREAQVLDRLRHAGVARIYDCGELADGRPWFACEHLVGPTLAEVIASGSRVDHAYVLAQLAAIVAHAHRAGIAHRNLRAEQVVCIVEPSGVWLVIDDWTATRELAQMPSDAAADVHALGVIALQMFGGVMAFSSGAVAMLGGSSVVARFPRAPLELTALVDRMLARDVRLRPSAADVAMTASAIVTIARRPVGYHVGSPVVEVDTGEVTRIHQVA
jgi:tRNA A-37 threonylcarbamoyl transferase component Bud32